MREAILNLHSRNCSHNWLSRGGIDRTLNVCSCFPGHLFRPYHLSSGREIDNDGSWWTLSIWDDKRTKRAQQNITEHKLRASLSELTNNNTMLLKSANYFFIPIYTRFYVIYLPRVLFHGSMPSIIYLHSCLCPSTSNSSNFQSLRPCARTKIDLHGRVWFSFYRTQLNRGFCISGGAAVYMAVYIVIGAVCV